MQKCAIEHMRGRLQSQVIIPSCILLKISISIALNTNLTNSYIKKRANSVILTQWRVLGEALNTHGFSRHHGDDGSVSGLQSLGVVLKLLAGTTVDLLLELAELASDVSGVAVKHGGVTLGDLTGVVQDDDLWRRVRLRSGCGLNSARSECVSLQKSR